MPLQHASAPVLKRMKRGAHGDIFLKLIERIRAHHSRRRDPHQHDRRISRRNRGRISRSLCDFVKAAQFDRLGVFSYSDEDTSASFPLDGKVDGRTIHNRKRKLMAIQRSISQRAIGQLIGREVAVLIEGLSPDTDLLWQARMSTQAPEIDGVCYVNDFAGAPPRRARSAACESPKRTITI